MLARADHCLRKTNGRPRCSWCSYNGKHRVQARVVCPTCEIGLCNPLSRACSWEFHRSGLTPKDLLEKRPPAMKKSKSKHQQENAEEDSGDCTTESNDEDLESD